MADGSLALELGMFNKTTTRLPEAMFVVFQPAASATRGLWSANKLGAWISAEEIVRGGAQHLHGITDAGIRVEVEDTLGERRTMRIASLDAAVANFGKLTAYPSPTDQKGDTSNYGSSFVLWDNLWGTNYVMWWPFSPPPGQYAESSKYFPAEWNSDLISRFNITFVSTDDRESLSVKSVFV